MQITHEEARRLIHLAFDEALQEYQKAILDAHLVSCMECLKYAESSQGMEMILRPLLQRQWSQQPIPLSIDALIAGQTSKLQNGNILLATRIAAVGIMFVMFMVSAWQFAVSKPSISSSMPESVRPIPIPSTSTQFVSTETQTKTCEEVIYIVQGNDTLGNIAFRFSTSKKEIMLTNNMKSETVITGMKILIPVCTFTPTGTVNASTITFTPPLHTITSTPGG